MERFAVFPTVQWEMVEISTVFSKRAAIRARIIKQRSLVFSLQGAEIRNTLLSLYIREFCSGMGIFRFLCRLHVLSDAAENARNCLCDFSTKHLLSH
jgi:hypothetical protein